jgi:hypothetical protein
MKRNNTPTRSSLFQLRRYALLILLLPINAAAFEDSLIGVQLDWNRYDTTLRMNETMHETRLTHATLIVYEPFRHKLYGGLRLGYVDVSQTDNPAVAGLGIDGHSLGMQLGVFLMRNKYVDISVQGDYDYLQASGGEDDQKVDFDWVETNIQFGATLKLGLFRLSGTAYRYSIDGDQKLYSPVNTTTRFSQTERSGTSAGIAFQVDSTGYIGVHAERGARDGVRLLFTREF